MAVLTFSRARFLTVSAHVPNAHRGLIRLRSKLLVTRYHMYWGPGCEAICLLLLSVSTCGICSSVPVKCSLGSVSVTSRGYKRCIERLVTPEFVLISAALTRPSLPWRTFFKWLTSRNYEEHFQGA